MSRKHAAFTGKMILVLLFGAFLNFCCVCAPVLALETSDEKKQMPHREDHKQVAAMKDAFTSLYWDMWTQRGMTSRLRECVVQAVEDYEGWFTAAASEKDYVKAQEEINKLLDGDLRDFLDDLQAQFLAFWYGQLQIYYRDLFEDAQEKVDNPEIKEKIAETVNMLLSQSDDELKVALSANAKANSIKESGSQAGTGLLAQYITKKAVMGAVNYFGLAEMLAGTVGAKVGALIANPYLIIGYVATNVVVKLGNGAENMRKGLYDPMLRYYLDTVPEKIWSPFEDPVRESFKQTYNKAVNDLRGLTGSY